MLKRWGTGLGLAVATLAWLAVSAEAQVGASPEEFMAAHTFPAKVDRDKLLAALKDAGQNWLELARALDDVGPTDQGFFLDAIAWEIMNAPHLDRLELTGDILFGNLGIALGRNLHHGYDPTSDFFRRYVLNYRIDDEPVTDWRGFSVDEDKRLGLSTQRSDPVDIAKQLMVGFEFQDRGFFGPESDPISILKLKRGTRAEGALLTAAYLRDEGFATRFVSDNASGTSWVEVYTGDPRTYQPDQWLPVYPQAPERSGDPAAAAELCGGRISIVTAGDAFGREQVTKRYSPTGTVQLSFTRAGSEVKGVDSYAITCWHDGQYVALDDLEYPVSAMDYPLDAGTPAAKDAAAQKFHLGAPGDYRLEAGVRYPGGVTDVHLQLFHVQPDSEQTVTLALDPPADLPMTALVERELGPPPAESGLSGQGRYVVAVYDTAEPSIRTRALLEPLRATNSVQYIAIEPDANNTQSVALATYLQIKSDDPRPVVAVIVDGATRLYRRGYDLNIADWVKRALEVQP